MCPLSETLGEVNERYHLSQPSGSDNPSSMNQSIQQSRLNIQRAPQLIMDLIVYQPQIVRPRWSSRGDITDRDYP